MILVTFIYGFVAMLNNADVEYLDVYSPLTQHVTCRMPGEDCTGKENVLPCLIQKHELFGVMRLETALPFDCPTQSSETCSNASLPLTVVQRDLGRLHTVRGWVNPLKAWAWLFAALFFCLWISIGVHDLTLLHEDRRSGILTLQSARQEMPHWWACISCLQCLGPMRFLQEECWRLWLVLLPVWTIYRAAAFPTMTYPVSLLFSLFAPLRMSRIMVAFAGILGLIWSAVFTVVTLASAPGMYAVFWNAQRLPKHCVCFCEFPLRAAVSNRLVMLGLVVCIGSFSIAFRALKGLRRANWGNLFSVLYTVPVEAFPVVWERPREAGGGPICFRSPGEAVQSEPAFDPFCLMDEQPESGSTGVVLRPVPQTQVRVERWSETEEADMVDIGCCGFPQAARRGKVRPQGKPREVPVSVAGPESDTAARPGSFAAAALTSTPGVPSRVYGVMLDDEDVEISMGPAACPDSPGGSPVCKKTSRSAAGEPARLYDSAGRPSLGTKNVEVGSPSASRHLGWG